jgi:hypothetical protein
MRKEFHKLLADLVGKYQTVDRQINARFIQFPMPTSNVIFDQKAFADLITRFFWHLFCPELNIKSTWDQHHSYVEQRAFELLKREYGSHAKIRTFEIARSGVEEGLWSIMETTKRLVMEEFFQNQTAGLISHYWETSKPEQLLQDAQDYINTYNRMLPGEMIEGSGAAILVNFRLILLKHPSMVDKLRHQVRC